MGHIKTQCLNKQNVKIKSFQVDKNPFNGKKVFLPWKFELN